MEAALVGTLDQDHLDKLVEKRMKLEEQISDLNGQLQEVKQLIQDYCHKNFPRCSCCGSHKSADMMWIASKEEEDNYRDPNNEGYAGPTAGAYYCGC